MSTWARFFGVSVLLSSLLCSVPARADGANAAPTPTIDALWLTRLSERADRLSRVLLSALYAARDESQPENAQCFDRALTELHGLKRQVAYHSERFLDPALEPAARERHTRALTLASARLDYVAQSTQRCNLGGVQVGHGQTRVETTIRP